MNYKNWLVLPDTSSNTKKTNKMNIKYFTLNFSKIIRSVSFLPFIILLFNIGNCIRITISFTNEEHPKELPPLQPSSIYPKRRKHNPEISVNRKGQTLSNYKNKYMEQIKNNKYLNTPPSNKLKKSIDNINEGKGIIIKNSSGDGNYACLSTSRYIPWSEIIADDSNLTNSEDNTDISSEEHIDSITFDYSSDFIIRSKYLDCLNETNIEELHLNIKDITECKIDGVLCEMLLFILPSGLDFGFPNLNNENFLEFIWFLNDISCYSKYDALETFYKNLLPFLYSYVTYINRNMPEESREIFSIHKKQLFPFIAVLYDTIDLSFDENTNELTLQKKKENRKTILFIQNISHMFKFRTDPETLNIVQQDDYATQRNILTLIFNSYEIYRIKISVDDKYWAEGTNPVIESNASEKCLTISEIKNGFSSIFFNMNLNQKRSIKSVELERIVLTIKDMEFLNDLKVLETLVIVHCNLDCCMDFLWLLPSSFPKLKILGIIGYTLKNNFFENINLMNIRILNLSKCDYNDNPNNLIVKKNKYLNSLKMNSSCLNQKVFKSMICSDLLIDLSLRAVDFTEIKVDKDCFDRKKTFQFLDLSECKFNDEFLDYFLTDLKAKKLNLEYFPDFQHLIKILDQESLHLSTEFLSLSGNSLYVDLYISVSRFKVLKRLKLSHMNYMICNDFHPKFAFKHQLNAIDLSKNRLNKDSMIFLHQFNNLKELNLSNCNLETGYMEILFTEHLSNSLVELNISGNSFVSSDFFKIVYLKNLIRLTVSFDNQVFLNLEDKYDIWKFKKLRTLILVQTNIEDLLYKSVMTIKDIKIIEFQNCKFEDDVLSKNNNLNPISVENIILINTKISNDDINVLRKFKINGINVSIK
ncbi:hypothetical protein CWI38_0409p0020 [Hamiltosporidium tvaerminnensis]|uniref:Leucine-rich repeat-containing protein n=2 Tax=Hamiltosporidium tvaerminnensis TaxID=1176355 RepID=A0A4Q9LXK5_9MICR|nr:hypothetical protein CWI38_0409p0020 [Hamiltosporidium tvaerminnensis]